MRWLLLLFPLLFGCAHADPLTSFAKAGVSYSETLNAALDSAEASAIDASSWRLLANDQLSNADLDTLEQANAQDAARQAQLDRLRTHAGLLARYLKAVASIADSELPETASKRVESIWTSTATLSQTLIGSPVLPPGQIITKPLELMLDRVMHKTVRTHIEGRVDALHREFLLQEQVLAALARAVAHERSLARQAALQQTVIAPLLAEDAVDDPQQWVELRRHWLQADAEPKALKDARRAAKALREAFEKLVEGKLDASAAEQLEAELTRPGLLVGVEVE